MFGRKRSHPALHHRVLVSMGTVGVRGIIRETIGEYLVIVGATIFEAGAAPTEADGAVIVHRDRIDYVQALADGND